MPAIRCSFGIGEDNLREAFGAVDIPLGETLDARLSAGIRQRDGYVRARVGRRRSR